MGYNRRQKQFLSEDLKQVKQNQRYKISHNLIVKTKMTSFFIFSNHFKEHSIINISVNLMEGDTKPSHEVVTKVDLLAEVHINHVPWHCSNSKGRHIRLK